MERLQFFKTVPQTLLVTGLRRQRRPISESEAGLVYSENSRIVRITQRNPASKQTKTNKQKTIKQTKSRYPLISTLWNLIKRLNWKA